MKRWQLILVSIAGVIVVAAFGYTLLQTQGQVSDLAPKVAGGSQTCSGGNDAACIRACQHLRVHSFVVARDGARLYIRCDARSATQIHKEVVAGGGSNPSGPSRPGGGGGSHNTGNSNPGQNTSPGQNGGTQTGGAPPGSNPAPSHPIRDTVNGVQQTVDGVQNTVNGATCGLLKTC